MSFYGNNYGDGGRYPQNHMDGRGMASRNQSGPDLRMLNNNRSQMDSRPFMDHRSQVMDRPFQPAGNVRGFEAQNDGRMMDHRQVGAPQQDLRNASTQQQQNRFPFPTTTIMPLNQGNTGIGPLIGGQPVMSQPKQNQFSAPQMMMQQFQRPPSVSERVQVPPELSSFASEPKFQQILLRVKEQTNVNFIAVNRVADNVVESVAIDAASKESAELAKNLIETHLKLQMKIKAAENRLQKVQTDLFSTQGEIAAGHVVECSVNPELIGLAIGKKGARIKQIETETGVSSINVADSGKITIYGPDAMSVQKAREQLELIEDSCPVTDLQADWFGDKANASYLVDLRTSSNLMVAKLNREDLRLDIVGTIPAVQMAKCLWSTHLEYVDRQIEIEEDERQVREQLHAVRKQYGFQSGRPKSFGGKNQHGNEPNTSSTGGKSTGSNAKNEKIEPPSKVSATSNSGTINSNNDRGRKVVETAHNEQVISKSSAPLDNPGSMDNALDALITYTPQEEKSSRTKKQSKDQKPVSDFFKDRSSTENFESRDSVKGNKKNEKSEGRERDNKGSKNENKSGRTVVVENRIDTADKSNKKDKNVSKNDSDPVEAITAKGDNVKANNNKDKGKSSKSTGQSEANLPPPPTLTVPPPASGDGAKGESNSKKKNNSSDKKSNSGKSDSDKQPMLVKINNPFLEQKNAKKAADVPDIVVPPQPEPSVPKVFGPPKEPPKNVTANKKSTEEESEKKKGGNNNDKKDNNTGNKDQSSGKGNTRSKDRNNKKEHSDLLTKVEILSVVTDDQQLVANLSAMKMDVSAKITVDQDIGDKNGNKKDNNKKKGKSQDISNDDSKVGLNEVGSKSSAVVPINEPSEGLNEPPLPKRNNARKNKDSPTPEVTKSIPQKESTDDSAAPAGN